jgi:hypothetical protein
VVVVLLLLPGAHGLAQWHRFNWWRHRARDQRRGWEPRVVHGVRHARRHGGAWAAVGGCLQHVVAVVVLL